MGVGHYLTVAHESDVPACNILVGLVGSRFESLHSQVYPYGLYFLVAFLRSPSKTLALEPVQVKSPKRKKDSEMAK